MTSSSVSIVITTRNRAPELRRALSSAMAQSGVSEVLMVDDGSNDDTSQLVRTEFPDVRLEQRGFCRGYIRRRNEAARLARGDIVVSIDDDAEFAEKESVLTVINEFSDSRIGAVAMPYINVGSSAVIHQLAPDDKDVWVRHCFRGTAYALRRDVFLHLGGYRDWFVQQQEEMEFCLRLLNEGMVVRMGRSAPILHQESAKNRNTAAISFFSQRNSIAIQWLNAPSRGLLKSLAKTAASGLKHATARGEGVSAFHGTLAAFVAMINHRRERCPISDLAWTRFHQLMFGGPRRLNDLFNA